MKLSRLVVLLAAILSAGVFGALPSDGARMPGRLVLAEGPVAFAFGAAEASADVRLGLDVCLPAAPVLGCFPPRPLEFALADATAGTTIWTDASDDGFAGVVERLTNGVGEQVVSSLTVAGAGGSSTEADFLGTDVGPNGIDLEGAVIERIGLRLERATVASPGRDPAGDGQWTDVDIEGVFVFEGYVTSVNYCLRGRWKNLERAGGTPFASQSDCVRYVAAGR